MIDFDKEEFLSRLDIRLQTMASMLAYHEKWLIDTVLPSEKARVYNKDIDKAIKMYFDNLSDFDNKLKKHFEKLKENYKID
jgi:hypothetical protein